jgi:hypothetical protein
VKLPAGEVRRIQLRTLRWPIVVLTASVIVAAYMRNAGWFGVGGAIITAIGSWLWARRVFRLQDPDAPPPPIVGPQQGTRGLAPVLGEGTRELQQRQIDNIVGRMGVRIAIGGGLIATLPFFLGLAHVWTPGK